MLFECINCLPHVAIFAKFDKDFAEKQLKVQCGFLWTTQYNVTSSAYVSIVFVCGPAMR